MNIVSIILNMGVIAFVVAILMVRLRAKDMDIIDGAITAWLAATAVVGIYSAVIS